MGDFSTAADFLTLGEWFSDFNAFFVFGVIFGEFFDAVLEVVNLKIGCGYN